METGTRQIVAALKAQIQNIKDIPKVTLALWQFGLSEDQRELAKQSIKTYIMSQVIGKTKRRQDSEEVDKILNRNPLQKL
jgi:hypothetical protein